MNREEFIGKLQLCYFGDRNAFNEIVSVYDELNTRIDKAIKYIETTEIITPARQCKMSDTGHGTRLLEISKGKNE